MVHVASSWRLRRDRVKDRRVDVMGCVRPYYPCFAIFFVLCQRGILVFESFLGFINRTIEGWGSLSLLHFYFIFLIVERVYHELDHVPIIK
jgi:hypothetical protein